MNNFGVAINFYSNNNKIITEKEIERIKKILFNMKQKYSDFKDRNGKKYNFEKLISCKGFIEDGKIDIDHEGQKLILCSYKDPESLGLGSFDERHLYLKNDRKNGLIIFNELEIELEEDFSLDFQTGQW